MPAIMNWLRRLFRRSEPEPATEPERGPEPDVPGQCSWRYPGGQAKCNRPEGHDGPHGKELFRGLILAPWPKETPSELS